MTRWLFRRHDGDPFSGHQCAIDASGIRRSWLSGKSESQICQTDLVADGKAVPLGELFDVEIQESAQDQILVAGDLANVHGLGAMHDDGEFRINGDVGNYLGCGMTGGQLTLQGGAGDFVGAPLGARKVGMSGGTICVQGDAGDCLGHRMRRGTIIVNGSAGKLLAASMVAGTIGVAGTLGAHLAVGMKRGSLILASGTALAEQVDREPGARRRFSSPVRFDPGFLSLYQDPRFTEVMTPLMRLPVFRTRADRSAGGIGEVIFPASAEMTL